MIAFKVSNQTTLIAYQLAIPQLIDFVTTSRCSPDSDIIERAFKKSFGSIGAIVVVFADLHNTTGSAVGYVKVIYYTAIDIGFDVGSSINYRYMVPGIGCETISNVSETIVVF